MVEESCGEGNLAVRHSNSEVLEIGVVRRVIESCRLNSAVMNENKGDGDDGMSKGLRLTLVRNVRHTDSCLVLLKGSDGEGSLLKLVRQAAANKMRIRLSQVSSSHINAQSDGIWVHITFRIWRTYCPANRAKRCRRIVLDDDVMQVRLFDTNGKELQNEADARASAVNRATLFVSSGESCIVKAAPGTGQPPRPSIHFVQSICERKTRTLDLDTSIQTPKAT